MNKEIQLINDLLYVLGMRVQNNTNSLVDIETGDIITFNGLNVKVSVNGNLLYLGEKDMQLIPNDPRCIYLLSTLLGRVLSQEHEYENIPKAISFFTDLVDKDEYLNKAIVKFDNDPEFSDYPRIVESNIYRCKTLCYIDLIFRIEGSFIHKYDNLSELDLSLEEIKTYAKQ